MLEILQLLLLSNQWVSTLSSKRTAYRRCSSLRCPKSGVGGGGNKRRSTLFHLSLRSCIVQIFSLYCCKIFGWHCLLALCFAQQRSDSSVSSISLVSHQLIILLFWIRIRVFFFDRFYRSMQLSKFVKTLHFRRL